MEVKHLSNTKTRIKYGKSMEKTKIISSKIWKSIDIVYPHTKSYLVVGPHGWRKHFLSNNMLHGMLAS